MNRLKQDPDPLIRGIRLTAYQVVLKGQDFTGFQPTRGRRAGGDTDHPRNVARVKKYGRFAFYSYPPVVFQKPLPKSSAGPKEGPRLLKLPFQYSLARLM